MVSSNTILNISFDDLKPFGNDLSRPECVKTTRSGDLFVSDREHAVTRLDKHGTSTQLAASVPEGFMCNGFSLTRDRECIIANLGELGGVWRLDTKGNLVPMVMEVDGTAIPPTNFVNLVSTDDDPEAMYISVSTSTVPRMLAFDRNIANGFIVRADRHGVRIVADEIGFTNENKLSPDRRWVYVSETIARRLSRYRVLDNGDLGPRETVHEFGHGIWPDGFEFDSEGGIWVAGVFSNRLIRVTRDGEQIILDDSAPDIVERAEKNFASGEFGMNDVNAGNNGVFGNLASVNFGGPDLKTVFLGSLFNQHLLTFQSPIAGATPRHFEY